MTRFTDFGLAKPILSALDREGHERPTPIQSAAIPTLLKGRDLLGIAQTGTGKTAAFALPVLHRLAGDRRRPAPRECRVLVLAPTRELALQVQDRFKAYGAAQGLSTGLVIGGVAFGKQRAMLHRGNDIIVATPGRLQDCVEKGALKLKSVEIFVLDEVDQMLDLGFIHSIRAIAAKLPERRQNIFFSATMPRPIAKLAGSLLNNPARVEIEASKPLKIDQSVIFIEKPAKGAALVEIVKQDAFKRGLVFSRTKHGADKIVRMLNAAGAPSHAIHGNRSQAQREKALNAFRKGKANILVATDIAARGIDIQDVSHVVNYDLPNVPETYTHRIGRTGRAGATGVAISFCSGEERPYLRAIEKLTQQRITVEGDDPRGDERPAKSRNGRPFKGGGGKPYKGGAGRRHKGDGKSFKHEDGAPANENRKRRKRPGGPKRAATNTTEPRANESGNKKRKPQGESGANRARQHRPRNSSGRKPSRQAG